MQRVAAMGLICYNLITQRSVYKCPYCNEEGLVFILYWVCFCDFNPHLAAFVIVGRHNGLPREDNLTPAVTLYAHPLKDSKEEKLTHPPA